MDPTIESALKMDMVVDITTTGRKTGQPRRKEIWSHYVGGRVFIAGSPGKRGWYANMVANPQFTLHLKEELRADVRARARPIVDPSERKRVLETLGRVSSLRQGQGMDLEAWVAASPLVEVLLEP